MSKPASWYGAECEVVAESMAARNEQVDAIRVILFEIGEDLVECFEQLHITGMLRISMVLHSLFKVLNDFGIGIGLFRIGVGGLVA